MSRKSGLYQTGGCSKQVEFTWNPVEDSNFHKLENGLSRQGGLSSGEGEGGVIPNKFHLYQIWKVDFRGH